MISRHEANKYNMENRQYYLDKFNHTCVHCGTHDDLCLDHIIPVSLGGGNSEDNIQILCRVCNSKKGGKKVSRKKKNKKLPRKIFLDDDTFNKAVQQAENDYRTFSNYVNHLITVDIRTKEEAT